MGLVGRKYRKGTGKYISHPIGKADDQWYGLLQIVKPLFKLLG